MTIRSAWGDLRWNKRYLKALPFVALGALLFADAASAETYRGKWGGQSPSTLEFVGGNEVLYCFKDQCTTAAYTGDRKGTLRFRWGSASFVFKWNGSGYDGWYRSGSQKAIIKMK